MKRWGVLITGFYLVVTLLLFAPGFIALVSKWHSVGHVFREALQAYQVDLPPALAQITEGEFSRGFSARGKPGPAALHGTRQGLNDYTGWFAGDAEMAGQYVGYDGPFPPFNDSLVHHYVFTLYALDLARLPLEGAFDGAQVREAIGGHVLDAATYSGTYTLNRRLLRG